MAWEEDSYLADWQRWPFMQSLSTLVKRRSLLFTASCLSRQGFLRFKNASGCYLYQIKSKYASKAFPSLLIWSSLLFSLIFFHFPIYDWYPRHIQAILFWSAVSIFGKCLWTALSFEILLHFQILPQWSPPLGELPLNPLSVLIFSSSLLIKRTKKYFNCFSYPTHLMIN